MDAGGVTREWYQVRGLWRDGLCAVGRGWGGQPAAGFLPGLPPRHLRCAMHPMCCFAVPLNSPCTSLYRPTRPCRARCSTPSPLALTVPCPTRVYISPGHVARDVQPPSADSCPALSCCTAPVLPLYRPTRSCRARCSTPSSRSSSRCPRGAPPSRCGGGGLPAPRALPRDALPEWAPSAHAPLLLPALLRPRARCDPRPPLPRPPPPPQPNPNSVIQNDEARGTNHLDFFKFVGRVVGKVRGGRWWGCCRGGLPRAQRHVAAGHASPNAPPSFTHPPTHPPRPCTTASTWTPTSRAPSTSTCWARCAARAAAAAAAAVAPQHQSRAGPAGQRPGPPSRVTRLSACHRLPPPLTPDLRGHPGAWQPAHHAPPRSRPAAATPHRSR